MARRFAANGGDRRAALVLTLGLMLGLMLGSTTPVAAQEAAAGDAIGELLATPAQAQAPATPAPSPRPEPPPAPWAPTAAAPPAPAAPRPAAATVTDRPVYLDERGRTPEGPPTAIDRNYEARLRASFASAQGLQGPLDGRWILSAADGGDLYALQFVDAGGAPLEGAWRDVRRTGAFEGSGFLTLVERSGPRLTLSFQPSPSAPPATASLSPTSDGRWVGDLDEGGRRATVVMRRD